MEILKRKINKLIKRCWYSADDELEYLSLCQVRKFKRLTPIFLSPRKDKTHTLKKLKEFKLPSVNNIKIGDIGFRFRKDFIGHGTFEGQVIEINNNLRRCIYSDGDIVDLNLEKLSYWNSKYLPSKKENSLQES